MRTETGPLKIGDDWTGAFIRGDEALGYANTLRMMATHGTLDPRYIQDGSILGRLIRILESCRESGERTMQRHQFSPVTHVCERCLITEKQWVESELGISCMTDEEIARTSRSVKEMLSCPR